MPLAARDEGDVVDGGDDGELVRPADDSHSERVPLTAADQEKTAKQQKSSGWRVQCSGCNSNFPGHSHIPRPGDGHVGVMTFLLCTNTTLTIVQLTTSILINSLALFIDSVDMTTDILGYGMNLFTEWYGQQPGKDQRSRLKLEIGSAAFSCVCTICLSTWTIYDGSLRLIEGEDHDLELGKYMLGFAAAGLVLNFTTLGLFYMQGIPTSVSGEDGELNMMATILHLLGDTVRMIVVLISGIYITVTGSTDSGDIDAWCAIGLSALMLVLLVPVVYGIVQTVIRLRGDQEDPDAVGCAGFGRVGADRVSSPIQSSRSKPAPDFCPPCAGSARYERLNQ